jgi:hypothetical protein
MKHLVLHPTDLSTTFLEPIYKNLPDATVITGGKTQDQVFKEIEAHDHIIMLGHGSPSGLFAIGQYPGLGYASYIIDSNIAHLLKQKKQLTTIWCYAQKFVDANKLGRIFYTDMFCSETLECSMMGFEATQEQVEESNWCFSKNLGEHILKTPTEIHAAMQNGTYAQLAKTNPVATYNFERLGCVAA